jgi:hypothetical protein
MNFMKLIARIFLLIKHSPTLSESAEHLLRTDPSFFIGLFVRKAQSNKAAMRNEENNSDRSDSNSGKSLRQIYFPRMSKMFLYYASQMRRSGDEACGNYQRVIYNLLP